MTIDAIAILFGHHVSDNDDGYAAHSCSIFTESFGARDLAVTGPKALGLLIAPSASRWQDVIVKVSWHAELSMLDQVLRPRKHANIA